MGVIIFGNFQNLSSASLSQASFAFLNDDGSPTIETKVAEGNPPPVGIGILNSMPWPVVNLAVILPVRTNFLRMSCNRIEAAALNFLALLCWVICEVREAINIEVGSVLSTKKEFSGRAPCSSLSTFLFAVAVNKAGTSTPGQSCLCAFFQDSKLFIFQFPELQNFAPMKIHF